MRWLQDTRCRVSDFLMRHAGILVISCAVILLIFMMYQTYISVERMFAVFNI